MMRWGDDDDAREREPARKYPTRIHVEATREGGSVYTLDMMCPDRFSAEHRAASAAQECAQVFACAETLVIAVRLTAYVPDDK